ncbi:MAG: thioredoxin [Paludibacteraceae bacterium]|nr:thioredoxin [Candidatus Colicola coprequi]MCQ2333138.1 thioredoxin [Paludibacteraceae bacterium]
MTLEITDANIQTLLAEGKPLVVDLWAPWCGPCKMMLPIVDELSTEYEGKIRVGKLNVDENPETCETFGIMNIPTMLFFKNGELVNRHVGASRKPDLQKLFDKLL